MHRSLLALGLVTLLAGCVRPSPSDSPALPTALSVAPRPGVFFVAPDGNDQWSGTRPRRGANGTEGPFATLPRALTAAREWRQTPGQASTSAPVILVRGGFYPLKEALVLRPEDSGLTIAAYRREQPVLSGGRAIHGWKQETVNQKTLWSAEIPEARFRQWVFRELWVNGQRATRARHPNQGYFKVRAVTNPKKEWTQGDEVFAYFPGDLPAWNTLEQADVVVMNRWSESHLPVALIQPKEGAIHFAKRSVFALAVDDFYYFEGAFEALDQPGEWYLDPHRGKVFYWPRPGEQLHNTAAVAPALAQVLRFEGSPEKEALVRNVRLSGLTFSHTEWFFPDGFAAGKDKPDVDPPPQTEVGGFAQAAIGVPGAVWGEGVRDCVLDRCRFTALGTYGLELTRGCQGNRILKCEFSDLGAGGIKLGETVVRTAPAEQTRGNEVSDCHIHDGGAVFHSAIGLWLGQSSDNRLTHNHIHDFYYTGISIGWTWGYGEALATNNLIAFNHVHHLGKKSSGDGPILSDMGGIYTLSMQPGTRIANNLWHDIAGRQYGGWGIYLDEGSSSVLVTSNVVYRTTHGGFHQHYGATNLVWNNVFAFARDHQVQRTRAEPHPSFSFKTNIVFFDAGVLLGGNWEGDKFEMEDNIYFDIRPNARSEDLRFGKATWQQWRQRGHDLRSAFVDPQFTAPHKDDFRLRCGSPALQRGFQPIDLSPVGVRTGGKN
jgi:hypothetical protein